MYVKELLEQNEGTVMKRLPSMKGTGAFARVKSLTKWCRKLRLYCESGSEIVEFAITANVFFLFCFGFMELCMVLFSVNSVSEASRQAARWASVRGTSSYTTSNGTSSCVNPNITTCPAQSTDISAYVKALPGMTAANTTVTVNWCNADGVSGCTTGESNAAPGHIVKVTVTYKYAVIPFVSSAALNLNSTAEKVIWE
jgi:Flp pilus assembly protein TadG